MCEIVLSLQRFGMWAGVEFIITFANTGLEHIETLNFVHRCDQRWQRLYNVTVVWLEADVQSGKVPTLHKVVSFETASRSGEPFEAVVSKYGIPNNNFLHCTRELKENPILSYMKSLGEKVGHYKNKKFVPASYSTWIGIRSDETKRLNGNKTGKQTKVYPLAGDLDVDRLHLSIRLSCDKQDVLSFWEGMRFDLQLPEHYGNCIDCHKKSLKKLKLVYHELGAAAFEVSNRLDQNYSHISPQVIGDREIVRKRYRGYRNTNELIALISNGAPESQNNTEESGTCSESCEPFMGANKPELSDGEWIMENDIYGEQRI